MAEILMAGPLQLDYVYPAGCQRGHSAQIEVGGNWADNPVTLKTSGEGVTALYTGPVHAYVDAKNKNRKNKATKLIKTELPGHSLLDISVEPQAEAGVRELYLDYRYEISNPLQFEVSDYLELTEPATNKVSGSLIDLPDLPVCLNGRIFGDQPDCYRFQATSGQKIVAFFKSKVMPLGGFVPDLEFVDCAGALVTNGVSRYLKGRAPVLVYEVAVSGDYTLQISDPSGQGGAASVYRIVLGELPLITDFSPKCMTKGKSANIKLVGFNLNESRVRLFSGGKDAAMCMQTIAGSALVLPGLGFELVEESVMLEEGLNDTAENALPLALPMIVQGSFEEQAGYSDFYSFEGVAGDTLYVDLAGTLCEPFVKVRNDDGAVVASGLCQEVSDMERLLKGDSLSLPFTCVTAGRYTVEVGLSQNEQDSRGSYRMRVGAPVPDYEVWMAPCSINIPRFGSALVDLYVHRIHGYDSAINVAAAFPPLGVASAGGYIAAGSERGFVTLWTDGPRHPRVPFYQEFVAESEFNGILQKKPVNPILISKRGHRDLVRTFEQSPTRVAYTISAMLINMTGEQPLVLSANKEREIVLSVKSVKGNLVDDYEYVVIAPEKGVVIKNKIASNAQDVVRVSLSLAAENDFKVGEKAVLIIGMVSKTSQTGSLTASSQAVDFTCK